MVGNRKVRTLLIAACCSVSGILGTTAIGELHSVDSVGRADSPQALLALEQLQQHDTAPATKAAAAQADGVTDWNEIADEASVAFGGPPRRVYLLALTHLAIHDALNTIDPRYATYLALPPADPDASPEAAVATAAYLVLSAKVPSPGLDNAYTAAIAALPPCPAAHPSCIDDGIAAGTAAAEAILELRDGDGSDMPNLPYTLAPGPGVYQPTPPALAAPAFANWANLAPFALPSGDRFRASPSALFLLQGAVYARQYNEVKEIGSAAVRSADPDSEESRIARFWPGGGANWNAVTRVIVDGMDLDLWEHARLFALLNVALSDSSITAYDTKYHYDFWRPVTAIHWGDDGNPATTSDPAWASYLPTPPYPDYVCGLTTNTGAAAEVLRRYFGTDRIGFTFTAVGITRGYATLSQAEAESIDARVFAGIHFRDGCERGVRMGNAVGRFAMQHLLQPERRGGGR